MSEHRNALFAAMAEQVAELQGADVSDTIVDAVCRALTSGVLRECAGADHVSIILVEGRQVVSLAATDDVADRLDSYQQQFDQGPCLEAAWEQRRVRIDDYARDSRWPQLTQAVLADTPVRSSVSFQLFRDARSMSALNLHSDRVSAFSDADISVGSAFAAQAALALYSGARQSQFALALASRDVIGQAKGVLMERYDVDATAAFDMLRQISQDTNTKLATLAQRLLDLDHPESAPPAR